jgi:hypothetical protein
MYMKTSCFITAGDITLPQNPLCCGEMVLGWYESQGSVNIT